MIPSQPKFGEKLLKEILKMSEDDCDRTKKVGEYKLTTNNWGDTVSIRKGTSKKVIATYYERGTLQAGENRPNDVYKGLLQIGKQSFVKGKMSHSGREHKDINLKTWHLALPNTAIGSFTISGDID